MEFQYDYVLNYIVTCALLTALYCLFLNIKKKSSTLILNILSIISSCWLLILLSVIADEFIYKKPHYNFAILVTTILLSLLSCVLSTIIKFRKKDGS